MVPLCAALAAAVTLRAEPVADAEREEIVARFLAQQQATTTFAADLTQRLQLRGLKRPAESTGRIRYRAPDALALHFEKPAGEFLIQTGDALWLQKSRKSLVHRTGVGENPLLMLFRCDVADVRARFAIAMTRTNGNLLVTLTSKAPDPRTHLVAIENLLTFPALEILSMRTVFAAGNAIEYEFQNISRNGPIDPHAFQPPP